MIVISCILAVANLSFACVKNNTAWALNLASGLTNVIAVAHLYSVGA